MNRPWMQLHTRDWLDSKELRRCSPESRGVLADLMCLAHEGEPYGYLADKAGPLTDEYMAARCFMPVVKFRRACLELVKFERLNRDADVFYIRRMVSDEAVRVSRAEGGRKSIGHPNTAPPKPRVGGLEGGIEGGIEGGGEGYPSMDPSVSKQGYHPPRARTDARSDSDSDSHSGRVFKISGKEDSSMRREFDEQWLEFESLSRQFWKDLIEEDLTVFWFGYRVLDFEQKQKATANLRARIDSGQDPKFVSKAKYFDRGEWKRPVAPIAAPPERIGPTERAIAEGRKRMKESGRLY